MGRASMDGAGAAVGEPWGGGAISMVERAVIGGMQHGRGEARGVAGGGARRRAVPAMMSMVEHAVIGEMPLWAGQGARIGGRWRAAVGGAAACGEVSGVSVSRAAWMLGGGLALCGGWLFGCPRVGAG